MIINRFERVNAIVEINSSYEIDEAVYSEKIAEGLSPEQAIEEILQGYEGYQRIESSEEVDEINAVLESEIEFLD